MGRIRKTVAFNERDQHQNELLEYIDDKIFSAYVKELIAADMRKSKQPVQIVKRTENGGFKIEVAL